MKNITIRQLQIFSVAATHLSFARAAEELHLTHAAISLQIKQLEEVSNSILFDRIGKRVYLTDAGEVLLDHARQILRLLKDADGDHEWHTFGTWAEAITYADRKARQP